MTILHRLNRFENLSDLADAIDPTETETDRAYEILHRAYIGDARYQTGDGDAARFLDDSIALAPDGCDLCDLRRALVIRERALRSHRINAIICSARGWGSDRFSDRRLRHDHRLVVDAIAILDERLRERVRELSREASRIRRALAK